MAASTIIDALMPDYAAAQQVSQDRRALKAELRTVPVADGQRHDRGYLARPASAGNNKLPGILVIHENRGLNPHIEDVARRLARGELHGVRARRPHVSRRLPGRRR